MVGPAFPLPAVKNENINFSIFFDPPKFDIIWSANKEEQPGHIPVLIIAIIYSIFKEREYIDYIIWYYI